MKLTLVTLTVVGSLLTGGLWWNHARGCGGYGGPEMIEMLRANGPSGLDRLLAEYDQLSLLCQAHPEAEGQGLASTIAEQEALIDGVSGQRYGHLSRLFWYTDLAQAQEQSQLTGKPILSLRLLGNLDEELTCANSRFFRVMLYPHPEISKLLREKFIVHWESVRPVPVFTVDFGDGRQMTRTITGNSIHYVLDAQGRPIDGLPGVHSPQAFLAWLMQMEQLADELRKQPEQRAELLTTYHRDRLAQLDAECKKVMDCSYGELAGFNMVRPLTSVRHEGDKPAEAAMRLAVPKSAIEVKAMRHLMMVNDPKRTEPYDVWTPIADKLTIDLAPITETLIHDQHAPALVNVERSEQVEQQLLARFKRNVALDTVRNQQELHRQLHQWFVEGSVPDKVFDLNEQMYASVFLTPRSDAWLGLYDADVYTALDGAGIVVTGPDGSEEPTAQPDAVTVTQTH
ncbi:MAG: hypothetical protein KDA58_01580 [Planctomycetaceae bacterium]|nr:hypothetical protein [Planctomycetaceae bacterium]